MNLRQHLQLVDFNLQPDDRIRQEAWADAYNGVHDLFSNLPDELEIWEDGARFKNRTIDELSDEEFDLLTKIDATFVNLYEDYILSAAQSAQSKGDDIIS